MENHALQSHQKLVRWSNRIFVASLVAIAYLTLFPFRFNFHQALGGNPFRLGASAKQWVGSDFFLNTLLFVPLGFGLSAWLRMHGTKRSTTLALVAAGGTFASYLVEFLQFYIPGRSSGWDDLPPNTMGALTGFLIYAWWGPHLLLRASAWGRMVETWLSIRRIYLLLLLYLGLWFALSVPLQRQTRLTNWDPRFALFVGNDASGRNAWKGRLLRLQIWNRALPEKLARQLTSGDPEKGTDTGLQASYDFTTSPPFLDQLQLLPALDWTPGEPQLNRAKLLDLDGKSWLTTKSPVANLTQKIQETNQFALRMVCIPEGAQRASGRIVSVSQSIKDVNLHLRQENRSLVFWFRNPLSEERSNLVWYLPGVFEAGQMSDILVSYDGSDASMYADGRKMLQTYRLGPGASLAHIFFYIGTEALDGYAIVYETLIFFPAGLLIGLAVRKALPGKVFQWFLPALSLFLPPVLLELLLIHTSGREILVENILLSLILAGAGCGLAYLDHLPMESQETLKILSSVVPERRGNVR